MAIQTLLAGGAIWGGTELIKALNIIPAITSQFQNLGFIIQSISSGAATLGEGFAAAFSTLPASLPIVLGVTAAVVGLGAAFKAIKDAEYKKSYEGITEAISKEQSEVDSLNEVIDRYKSKMDDLTEAEKEYLQALEDQKKFKEDKITQDQIKAYQALEREVQDATTAVEDYIENEINYGTRSYNTAERALEGFVQQVQNGERYTESYKQGLQDFISTYGDYVTKLKEAKAAGYSLSQESQDLINIYDVVNNELKDLNGTLGDVNESTSKTAQNTNLFKENYKDVKTGIEEATAALEKYNQATSYDYSSALSGYASTFQNLKKAYGSGKINVDQVRAGVELFFGEDKKAELNYDLEKYSEELGKLFSGNLNKVLGASDPMQGFVNAIMEGGGKIVTESGEVAAFIDSNNNLTIKSYAKLAEWLGTTEEVARSLMGQIQQTSGQFVFAEEDINNLSEGIRQFVGETNMSTISAAQLVAAIQNITGSANPEEIMAYIDALKEIGAVDPSVEVTADTINAVNNVNKVKEAEDKVEDKEITIKALADSTQVRELSNAMGNVNSKTVTITTILRTIDGATGRILPYNTPHAAKGTESAKGGATLVNDGEPVNGSSAEAIISNGKMYIAGNGEETITNLDRGAEVLNAADTQAMLRKTGLKEEDLYGGIPTFGTGTTKVDVSKYTGGTSANYNPNASGTVSINTQDSAAMKEEFDKWLKEKKHYLAMDIITEEEYYRDLEKMNEQYLKDRAEYLDEYWQHQEEIYNYQKRGLQDIIDLEEKLNNLAKAKTQKVLVYKDGMFQYVQNTEAISRAQTAVNAYADGTINAKGGLDLVGEEGAELRVINSGDGIIPADITRNLMKIGKYGDMTAMGKSVTDIFNIGTVKLEKINDVEGLFGGLKNLALQTAASRT